MWYQQLKALISIKAGHQLVVGDYLVVRGKNYRVVNITPDDCFTIQEGERNIFTVDRVFENSVKKQPLRFRKMVLFNGSLHVLKSTNVHPFRPFTIDYKKNKNGNNHGVMEIGFSCAVFNISGFYTRCIAIPETDMQM